MFVYLEGSHTEIIQAKMALSQVRLPLDSKWFGCSIKTQPALPFYLQISGSTWVGLCPTGF